MNLVLLQNYLDNTTFAVLFCTVLIYWCGASFPKFQGFQTVGTTGIIIANLCIATLLGARWLEAGYFPLSNLYESLFFLAWGITTIHLIAENISGSRLVGAFTSPIVMGLTAFAALSLPPGMQMAEPLVPALKSNWLMMHVSVTMLSYSALMVGSLLAIAFLFVTRGQNIQLTGSSTGAASGYRHNGYYLHKLGKSIANSDVSTSIGSEELLSPQRLNIAETLDNVSYRMIGLGFPLLTIGIISGAVWANEAWGSYWSWDPKETWALIAWLVFAAYLHARITRGWQGRRPAIIAASGFFIVWICYLGVNLLGKGLHSYGWLFNIIIN